MDEDAATALSVICADYRAMFVPPRFERQDFADQERANRSFCAIGLAGSDALFIGADRILDHLDALCRVAGARTILSLADNPILEDLAPRLLGFVCHDAESELLPHLRWLLAAIRGRAGDISSVWREKSPEDALAVFGYLYKHGSPAYVLIREATGVRPATVSPSADATECAIRLGLVSWTDEILSHHGAQSAFRAVLDDFEDDIAWEATEWFSRIQCCSSPFSPRCQTCNVFNSCEALALGMV